MRAALAIIVVTAVVVLAVASRYFDRGTMAVLAIAMVIVAGVGSIPVALGVYTRRQAIREFELQEAEIAARAARATDPGAPGPPQV